MSDIPRGAVVRILDKSSDSSHVLTPSYVEINGVDVGLIAADGVQLNVGGHNEVTTVTITLMPSQVIVERDAGPRSVKVRPDELAVSMRGTVDADALRRLINETLDKDRRAAVDATRTA